MLANYTSTLGSSILTLVKTIQVEAGTDVHESSQLAAVYLYNWAGYRLYYQEPTGAIKEVGGRGPTWTGGKALTNVTAIGGSPLAASWTWDSGLRQINLFYVDSTTKSLFNVVYNSGWTSGTALGPAKFDQWDGTNTALAAVAELDGSPGYLRTYYIGADNHLYETWNQGTGQTWNATDYMTFWPKVDFTAVGSLASISWDDQVRVYYVSASNMVELLLNDTWTVATSF